MLNREGVDGRIGLTKDQIMNIWWAGYLYYRIPLFGNTLDRIADPSHFRRQATSGFDEKRTWEGSKWLAGVSKCLIRHYG